MEGAYHEIGSTLAAICPQKFEKVWVEAEVKDDWDRQTLWCEANGEKSQPDIDALEQYQLGENLRKIRAEMVLPGQEPWSRCTFTLFPDGKFKFDVEYDD